MKKVFLNAALALCTVGAAVWAVGVSEDAVSKLVKFPSRLFHYSMIVGGLLVFLGLCFLIVGALFSMLLTSVAVSRRLHHIARQLPVQGRCHPVQNVIDRLLYGEIDSRYVPVNARNRDLIGLHDLYSKYFGTDVPSIDLMRGWIDRCKSAFVLVHCVKQESGLTTRQQLVGSFKLLPLTEDAKLALETRQVTGSTFHIDHIARNKKETVAYYVGDVVATSQIARGMVLAHLTAACTPAVNRGFPVYARPLTQDGLRVMTKYGFMQVTDGKSAPVIGSICKVQSGKSRNKSSRRRVTVMKATTSTDIAPLVQEPVGMDKVNEETGLIH